MKVVCFACHKEGHTIQFYFKLFSHVKIKESVGKQELKGRQKRNGFKSKKNAIVMQAMCSAKSDDSDTEASDSELGDKPELNLILMAQVEESPSIDVNEIITSKNITYNITIELLRKIALSKNKELESKR
jgi:hypothetical protein